MAYKVLAVLSFVLALARAVTAELLGTNFGVANLNKTFDYVVVGGGNGGLAVASRLSEDPAVSVAVVEAGKFQALVTSFVESDTDRYANPRLFLRAHER